MFMLVNKKLGTPLGVIAISVQGTRLEYTVGECTGSLVSGMLTANNKNSLWTVLSDDTYRFYIKKEDIAVKEFTLCACN